MKTAYYRLAFSSEIPHENGSNFEKADALYGTEPKSLEKEWPSLTIRLTSTELFPDYYKIGALPLVSRQFQRLCLELNVNAEFLPVKVVSSARRPVPASYSIMNLLERVDCIDYVASAFERYGTEEKFSIKRYSRLVFRENAIAGRQLFRPIRDARIYVSSNFIELCKLNRLAVAYAQLESLQNEAQPGVQADVHEKP